MKNFIISIVNAKGGVGKSTVTCNLGAALSRQGKKVLIIDLDPQANTTSILTPINISMNSFYEFLEGTPLEKCIHPTFEEKVWCIPNTGETNNLEPEIIKQQNFDIIKRVRTTILKNYDFCLCDCPPNMGTWVISALLGSDFVIIPTLANSTFSIDGLLKAITLIEQIRQNENEKLKFLRLLVNQVDKRKSISKFNIKQLKQHFPEDKIFRTLIPTNSPFETAEANKKTIFQEAPSSNGCKAYRLLAKELLSIFE